MFYTFLMKRVLHVSPAKAGDDFHRVHVLLLAATGEAAYLITVKSGVLFPPILQHCRQYCNVHALIAPS